MTEEQDAIIVENISKAFTINKTKGAFTKIKSKIDGSIQTNIIQSLDQVSFSVKKGEMLGIIGLNGSGKTTLLRTIAGIYRPDAGRVIVNGTLAPMLHIGTGFHPELNALENIIMFGMLMGIPKKIIQGRIGTIVEFADLKRFSEMKLKHYSSGMRARLAFSTSLQIDPDILLVDEVLAVGDKVFREKSFEAFLSFKEKGKTILYTTHNLEKLSELSDRILFLHQGKAESIGNPEEVIAQFEEMTKKKKN